MTLEEKTLYHQIYPVKLATDVGATPLALYWFWHHKPIPALLVSFVPSILASWLVIRYADLEPYKESRLGHYVQANMTPTMQGVRLGGFGVMAIGAWSQRAWLMPVGLGIVLFGWLRGVLFSDHSRK